MPPKNSLPLRKQLRARSICTFRKLHRIQFPAAVAKSRNLREEKINVAKIFHTNAFRKSPRLSRIQATDELTSPELSLELQAVLQRCIGCCSSVQSNLVPDVIFKENVQNKLTGFLERDRAYFSRVNKYILRISLIYLYAHAHLLSAEITFTVGSGGRWPIRILKETPQICIQTENVIFMMSNNGSLHCQFALTRKYITWLPHSILGKSEQTWATCPRIPVRPEEKKVNRQMYRGVAQKTQRPKNQVKTQDGVNFGIVMQANSHPETLSPGLAEDTGERLHDKNTHRFSFEKKEMTLEESLFTEGDSDGRVAEDIGPHQLERLVVLLTAGECEELISVLSHGEESIFQRLDRLSPERNQLQPHSRRPRNTATAVRFARDSAVEWHRMRGGANDLTAGLLELTPDSLHAICSFHHLR
ncbi:hypothetical protein E1301_Tti002594 [Triplophysa tibetana]|uniref:Uncharacterized protein n=1 Tax=Triplophysa tibetana TaxID=1572043 RepID=A0A5A9NCZ6_9TELE|nr:hypothetical protein E1301_Tti002594 [Triplophysa tibetana]